MVHILYSVNAFVCALVLYILQARINKDLDRTNPTDNAFLFLIGWTTAFCIIDSIWGIFASHLIKNDMLLFFFSTMFHLCAAFTPLVWLRYVGIFLNEKKLLKFFSVVFNFFFVFQIALLILNFFNKKMFYIDADGFYCSTYLRRYLFYIQYMTYIVIAVFSFIRYITNSSSRKNKNYLFVLLFDLAPIGAGIFQMFYPDAPAYSIGYMIGSCIIYSFVVSKMLNLRIIEKAVFEASNKSKTEFLFNMSHDIRTPMNAILGYTNVALHSADNKDKIIDSLKKIEISGNHLLNLINEILEMSRIESGKLSITNDPMNILYSIESVHQISQSLANSKNIKLNFNTKNISNPFVFGDELHLNEILLNLLSNAIKYTNDGGQVDFTIEQLQNTNAETGRFKFTVKDNGIGMSEQFQTHLFESFSREQTSTVSKQEGTGLGLAIVKKIVELSNGTIKVESKIKVGSTFIIELPFKLMNSRQISGFKKEKKLLSDSKTGFSLKGKKALLAEDNEFNREITIESLSDTGVIIDSAEDGKIAVKKVQENGTSYYDFILMDIQMPEMNGYEATDKIRKLSGGDRIPIIALSANAFKEDKEKSLAAGMNNHIAKPINKEELLKAIHDCLK
ncbi:MAG: response regulator [Treponema sp.]|nr:response regulator [Candidatus Treponema merdequi]